MNLEMPKPGAEHKKMEQLAGSWVGEETLHPSPWDPKGGKATGRVRARIELGGFHLITDYEQERGGAVNFRGHGVLSYDPRGRCYTMHWFDVMGFDPGPPAYGTWEGETLQFQHSHHKGHSRYTYVFEKDGLYTLKIEMSPDGKSWMPFLTGNYTRVSKRIV